jgi:ABC-type antimicrobial peptide transport system permease subunit
LATARERTKSTAVLRASGASTAQIASSATVAGAATAACAVAIGMPLGLWLQRVLGDAITSSIGVGPGASPGAPGPAMVATIALLMLLAVGAVTSVTLLTARRVVARTLAAD